jgi:hypothetical protein
MTMTLVAIYAVTMATLDLWLSAIANAVSSGAWGVLAVQRYLATKLRGGANMLTQLEDEVEVTLGIDESDRDDTPLLTRPKAKPSG